MLVVVFMFMLMGNWLIHEYMGDEMTENKWMWLAVIGPWALGNCVCVAMTRMIALLASRRAAASFSFMRSRRLGEEEI